MNEKGKFTPPEAGDANELSPDQTLSFKDAIFLFNPEDREEAEMFLGIYKRCSNLGGTDFFELYGDFGSFYKSMDEDEQKDANSSCVFHLFSGSSREVKDWKELPLKSKSGKLEAYILGEFLRKLEGFEEKQ